MVLDTWFKRLLVFVVVLIVLDRFFTWNMSIVGSLVATAVVYFVIAAIERRGSSENTFKN